MKFRIAVLGATGFIGSPYRREIRECPEEAIIVSLCGRRRDLLQPSEHPGLDDGYRIQLFTDAAARSARTGTWVAWADVEDQLALEGKVVN
jgi:nucleoside-diphosphate-sugar epimerase